MKHPITLICATICLLLAFSGAAAETIKVASIFTKTGKAALENEPSLYGIRYAIEEVNRRGGVLGREIELLEFDSLGTALGSKVAARQAIEAGAVTVFGASWSSQSLAMAPVLQEAGIPMISPYSTNPLVTLVGDYIFRICFTDRFQGELLAKFAFNDLGSRTAMVLLNVDSQYSEGLANHFIQYFTEEGGEIVLVESYLEKASDFKSFIEKAKELKPDVIFHPGHTHMSAYVLMQAQISNLKTTFLGGDGWNDRMYDIAGEAIEGNYFSNHWHQDNPREESRNFVEKYQRQSREMGPGYALSEDSVFLFVDAVRRADSLEPSKIRDAIAATENFQGVTGQITFNENGDPIKPAVIMKFGKNAAKYVKSIDP